MPQYGSNEYWNNRYARVETSFDWMVDFEGLRPTLLPLLGSKDKRILIVGCGDAEFSPDLFYVGGYFNQVNVDYSEFVIEKQKRLWPEMDWRVMDCLDMKEVDDNSFDVVIDKSLIDTVMCYTDGTHNTMRLYSELHRVLKPGGRLITISLHTESEVLNFGCLNNPNCSFVASSCSLLSARQADVFHALVVFDKVAELENEAKSKVISAHPLEFVNAVDRKASARTEHLLSSGSDTDEDSVDYHFGFSSQDDLIFAFGRALDDVFIEEHDVVDGLLNV